MDVVVGRLELLKREGMGFNQSEIVKQLSEKFQYSERSVYYNFEKLWELVEEYSPRYPPDYVLAENHTSFIKGIELFLRRAIDLLQEATRA